MGVPGGIIESGAVADITVFDADHRWTVNKNMFFSKGRNTPFDGFRAKGAVCATIVNGKVVYRRDF